jgi:putative flavoprotein involved in K+ transport
MQSTTTVIIGAGHAGLATSACLSKRGVEHILLERGEVANSWRHERWDSLQLLTPNFQSDLPGYRYSGDDPEGFMAASEVVDFITDYAAFVAAPVQTNTTVTSVSRSDGGYSVQTNQGMWSCRTLVLANGACNLANVPAISSVLPEMVGCWSSELQRQAYNWLRKFIGRDAWSRWRLGSTCGCHEHTVAAISCIG